MRSDSVGPKAPRSARPALQRTTARYPHQGLGSGAAPVRSFRQAPPGEAFTPRQFRGGASFEDLIPDPAQAGEADLDLQHELPSLPRRPDALGHDGFGIPSQKLDAAHKAIEPQFQRFYQRAENRERSKRDKSAYVEKTRTVKSAGGAEWEEKVWERREEKRCVKLQAWQTEKGRKIQTGLNKVDRIMREKTGRPRKTGSNYATDNAKDDLLTPGKQTLNDNAADAAAVAVALNQVPANYAANEDPVLAADLTPMTDGLTALAVGPALADAAFGAGAYLGLRSEQEKAKQALNLKNDARRFLVLQAEATPEEAENYLKFMAAGGKLFEPTLEDASTMNATVNRVVRTGVVTPLLSAGGAALEIANTAVSVTPMANVALAPVAVVGGGVKIAEGRDELLRRVDQKARAEGRKEGMKAVLQEFKDHPEHGKLLEGLVDCLDAQQDRLIRQATREKKYALGRIFDGGGTIGGALGVVAALGTLAGLGVLTAATAGAATVPLAGLAAGWGTGVAMRNGKRAGAEHTSKWRQRAVRALEFRLLEALDIDAIKLLAICKAASAKPANAQLDFIKSHLAPALGIKVRMQGGVQALPHVSVFLRHFESARSKVHSDRKRIEFDRQLARDIRNELAMHYPDTIAGLEAFDKAIGTFVEKTQNLPGTDMSGKIFLGQLKDVLEAGKPEAVRLEANRLLEQIEQFPWPDAPSGAATPRIPLGN